MKEKLMMFAALVAASGLAACVSVKQDKPFEVHVRVDIYEHAAQDVDDLTGPAPKTDKPKSALDQRIAPELVTASSVGGAERTLDEIKAALRARAEEVGALKTAGAIGENSHGYLGVVDASKGKGAAALVEAVNADRKALYQKRAAQDNSSLQATESAYAEQWQKKAPAGEWIEKDGKWVKK